MTTPPEAPLRVCLVALHALPVIDSAIVGPIGGTETRAWMLARGLAAREETDVVFVVRHSAPLPQAEYDGVRVMARIDRLYPLYESVGRCLERRPGFPWLFVRRWDPKLLWQAPLLAVCRPFERSRRAPCRPDSFFTVIAADMFGTFGVQANSARVIASAHATGRKAVLFVGSDGDLDERYTGDSEFVSPYGDRAEVCRFILREADQIVVQTSQQRCWLKQRFGREGFVLANPFDIDAWESGRNQPLPAELTGGRERFALWVGRAEEMHKRPGLCLELARMCPEVEFLMVLNRRDVSVEDRVRQQRPPNVHVVAQVPHQLMPALFRRAAVLVSTSSLEGFPNVFLQAAASGVPIASLEVGQGFIEAARCGACTKGDRSQLAEFVRHAWSSGATKEALIDSDRARAYVIEHHSLADQAARLSRLLQDLCERGAS